MKKMWLKGLVIVFCALAVFIFSNPVINAQTCMDNYQCPLGQYCKKDIGNCFGTGICTNRPSTCYFSDYMYRPQVCGCDGITYSNSACAAMAGVNVAYTGACTPDRSGSNLWPNYWYPNYWYPNWNDPYWYNWSYPNYWYDPYFDSYCRSCCNSPYGIACSGCNCQAY